MTNWNGLDPGGTEQLWEPDVLLDMLSVMKEYEPFARNDENSPIFPALEQIHPQITWRNTNADGSFRPIFRKANPLVKLGLVSPETSNAVVTTLGDELLSGVVNYPEVFSTAAKSHREQDGTPSMALMCSCACELPGLIFTLEDIEFGISKHYDPSKKNGASVIDSVRNRNLKLDSNSGVRTRRLRNFMYALTMAGAFTHVQGGWQIDDLETAKDIAGELLHSDFAEVTFSNEIVPKGKFSSFLRSIDGDEHRSISVSASQKVADPEKRALLLERASNSHERVIKDLTRLLIVKGLQPVEDIHSFDIGVFGESEMIIEVKSINQRNCVSQIRKAVAQLPEYKWRYRTSFSSEVPLIVALDQDPRPFLDEDFFDYLILDRGLTVIWREDKDFVDFTGTKFPEVLGLD